MSADELAAPPTCLGRPAGSPAASAGVSAAASAGAGTPVQSRRSAGPRARTGSRRRPAASCGPPAPRPGPPTGPATRRRPARSASASSPRISNRLIESIDRSASTSRSGPSMSSGYPVRADTIAVNRASSSSGCGQTAAGAPPPPAGTRCRCGCRAAEAVLVLDQERHDPPQRLAGRQLLDQVLQLVQRPSSASPIWSASSPRISNRLIESIDRSASTSRSGPSMSSG